MASADESKRESVRTEAARPAGGGDAAGFCFVVVGAGGVAVESLPSRGEVVAGRGDACALRLDDTKASRAHLRIRIGDGVDVTDLGSTNGASIGDHKMAPNVPVAMAPGDVVTIGSTRLVLRRAPRAPTTDREAALDGLVERVAQSTINALVVGETGAGKEVTARTLHAKSQRAGGPLVCFNCAAISDALLESELFGYERGAFTGATQSKPGLLETAEGGTVFLDEIGEMPLGVQAKLLRVLEQREVQRVGGLKPKPIDVRFVFATNRDLEEDVRAGRFREDLYFRINGITIEVPPLRERPASIVPLAREFLARASAQANRPAPRFADAVLTLLALSTWPGNVRELRNVVERALVLCAGDAITLEHVPIDKLLGVHALAPTSEHEPDERSRIASALERARGNQTEAARLLGMSRRTLVTRLAEYGFARPRKPPGA